MAFNNLDIDSWKTLFDLCLEQIDRDVGDLIREVQEENEDRVYANIPDLNEPYDDGHGRNSIETPMNDDRSSNSNDSIETSEESSVLPQVVVSVESSGSGLPHDNVSVESFDNDTLRFETLDIDQKQKDSLNSISQKSGVGKEAEDIIQEVTLEDDEERRRAYSYLHELFSSLYSSAKKESESDDDNNGDDSAKKESKSDDENNGEDGSHDNNGDDSAKKESKSDDENNGEDGSHDNNGDDSTKRESKSNDENNGEDGSQNNLHESNEQNDSLRFEKLDIDQKKKYCLDIYQQLEGASMEADDIDDIIQELQIIKVPSNLGMDIELLKEEVLNPVHQRLENLSKPIHDIEKEVALEDRRRADSFLQELHSSFKISHIEESITEESDEENDSSNEENDSVTDEMYYSCDSDPWDTMPDISDYESCRVDMNSESSSGIDGTIWDRLLANKSPNFCVDNKVASEKSTVESDGNEASEPEYLVPPNFPEEIKHGDEMNSAGRNPIIISSSSSYSDADINTSMESDMEDIHLTDDEFEQTWEFISPRKVHSIPSQQQKEKSIKERFLGYFGRRKMVADDQSA